MTVDADGPTQPTVSDLVDRLDEDVVRRLLGDAAARDEETGRAVRLAAAGPSERLEVLAAEVDSAADLLAGRSARPFAHVVVDEAQDLHPAQWRLLREAVAPGPNDLFIAGDAHQRIYDHRVSLLSLGIDTRGKSRRLKINYRTSQQILGWTLGILTGQSVDDLDGDLESEVGYRSASSLLDPRQSGSDRACPRATPSRCSRIPRRTQGPGRRRGPSVVACSGLTSLPLRARSGCRSWVSESSVAGSTFVGRAPDAPLTCDPPVVSRAAMQTVNGQEDRPGVKQAGVAGRAKPNLLTYRRPERLAA